MKVNADARQSAILHAEEAALRARLLAILPGVVSQGGQLFLNSANSTKAIARYSHNEADDLFTAAERCIELREKLGLETEGSVADKFLVACREAASGDAHRRGPRKLAEWLTSEIK